MKLYVFPNATRESQLQSARQCIEILEKRLGAVCVLSPESSVALFGKAHGPALSPAECDLIVAIGGDGTVLRAAQTAIAWDKPILGINAGRLGYLCALDASALAENPEKLHSLALSNRSLLAFSYEGQQILALNDVVITKENFGATVTLDVERQQRQFALWRGDGLILSTPTGSTSYCLSAGGPVVDPAVDALILTPICPHFGDARASILGADEPITVSVQDSHANQACIYADGLRIGLLRQPLTVRRSEKYLRLYTRNETFGGLQTIIGR